MHTDATQYWFKASPDLSSLHADLITVSGHKIGSFPGIGGLFVSKTMPPTTAEHAQERGYRAGTENLPGARSFRWAAEAYLAHQDLDSRCEELRTMLVDDLMRRIDGLVINNATPPVLVNTLNIRFPSGDGQAFLLSLHLAGLMLSAGSACSSGANRPSSILRAIGLDETATRRSIRISMGPETTELDVRDAAARIHSCFEKLVS